MLCFDAAKIGQSIKSTKFFGKNYRNSIKTKYIFIKYHKTTLVFRQKRNITHKQTKYHFCFESKSRIKIFAYISTY